MGLHVIVHFQKSKGFYKLELNLDAIQLIWQHHYCVVEWHILSSLVVEY
jgi:hypothetical protein